MSELTSKTTAAGPPGSNSRRGRKIALIAAPIALGAVGVAGLLMAHSAPQAPPPPASVVTVSAPLVRDVSLWDDYVGRFAASKSVEVRPRVSGAVTAIHFQDGQMVKAGELLFTIDGRPFQAALAGARAELAAADSAVALARSDYARAAKLQGDEALAASEMDALQAKVQSAEASVAAAKAHVQARALDLEFTQVRAPLAGRISSRRVDPGNLVVGGEGTSATLMTTINALDPIYFEFDASEALYLKGRREAQADSAPVQIKLQDESGYRWKGKLDFTDNGIDVRSGTIRARAVLANPKQVLTPGLFGNMRMANGKTVTALLIPDDAVQTDQAKKSVLVVGKDNTVSGRTVELGPEVDGLRVVSSGLTEGDRVIIAGGGLVAPGATVKPRAGTIRPSPEAAPVLAPLQPAQATLASAN